MTRLLYGDPARRALLVGAGRMAGLLRPTLGPLARTVAIDRLTGSRPPEILDSGATIARRTLQIRDPFEDMGAMIVRHVAWRVFDEVGDGSATAAVLCHAALREAIRVIAAGAQPVAVRHGLECALRVARESLRNQARPIDQPALLATMLSGTLREVGLAETIAEVIDSVGPDGAIDIQSSEGTRTLVEYVDGVRWNEGFVSSFLLPERDATSVRVLEPRILLTNHTLDRAEQLLPTLEACVAADQRNLLVVAPEIRDAAVGLLTLNRERGVLQGVLAVKAPAFGEQRTGILEDLATITGGRCLTQERHDRLEDVRLSDLGHARQAWATRLAFGILGGRGDRAAIRQRIAAAKAELSSVGTDDAYTRDKSEQEDVKLRIEAAVRATRCAVQDGVVAGSGAALLACIPALERMPVRDDKSVGVHALARALAEPMRCIIRNAGLESEPLLHEARTRKAVAFDVVQERWRDDLFDPLTVVQTALETAISAAASALTAEVLIRRTGLSASVSP